jgi:hypothetical protein
LLSVFFQLFLSVFYLANMVCPTGVPSDLLHQSLLLEHSTMMDGKGDEGNVSDVCRISEDKFLAGMKRISIAP